MIVSRFQNLRQWLRQRQLRPKHLRQRQRQRRLRHQHQRQHQRQRFETGATRAPQILDIFINTKDHVT